MAYFPPENLNHLTEGKVTFGIGSRIGQFDWPGFRFGGHFIQIQESCPAPYTNQHKALIGDDARQPGSKLGITFILIQMLEGLETGGLRLVLSVASIAQIGAS